MVIYYGRSEKEAAVQGGAVLSSGEPDRASGVLLRRGGEEPLCRVADASRQAQVQIPTLRTCMMNNDIFTATYSPGSDPLIPWVSFQKTKPKRSAVFMIG